MRKRSIAKVKELIERNENVLKLQKLDTPEEMSFDSFLHLLKELGEVDHFIVQKGGIKVQNQGKWKAMLPALECLRYVEKEVDLNALGLALIYVHSNDKGEDYMFDPARGEYETIFDTECWLVNQDDMSRSVSFSSHGHKSTEYGYEGVVENLVIHKDICISINGKPKWHNFQNGDEQEKQAKEWRQDLKEAIQSIKPDAKVSKARLDTFIGLLIDYFTPKY